MALSCLTGPQTALFEIRLDQEVVLLRGSQDEASDVCVTGTVVLCLRESLDLKSVRLRSKGTRRICWLRKGSGPKFVRQHKHVEDFWIRDWTLCDLTKDRRSSLEAGNYEFPFEIVFPGNAIESLEGLKDSWIVYRLKATIDRGQLAQKVYAHKHLRVVRTLSITSLEIGISAYFEGFWPDKVKYEVRIARKAVVLGTPLHFQVKLTPSMKGLRPNELRAEVLETQEVRLWSGHHKARRTVASTLLDPSTALATVNELGEEGWEMEGSIVLPASLVACLQDIDRMGITVTHRLQLEIRFDNPDGHVSMVRVRMPFIVYISPNVVLNDSHEITNSTALSQQDPHSLDFAGAPPTYGAHQADQAWRDIDPRGYITPIEQRSGSVAVTADDGRDRSLGTETVEHRFAHRPGFASNRTTLPVEALRERLRDLRDIASSPRATSTSEGRPSQANLNTPPRSRSQSEQSTPNEPNSASPRSSGYFDAAPEAPDTPQSGLQSRQSEDALDLQGRSLPPSPSQEQVEYDQATLAKVPSYQTAMQTPAGTPLNRDLPSYDYVTGTVTPAVYVPPPAQASQHRRLLRRSLRSSPRYSLDGSL